MTEIQNYKLEYQIIESGYIQSPKKVEFGLPPLAACDELSRIGGIEGGR